MPEIEYVIPGQSGHHKCSVKTGNGIQDKENQKCIESISDYTSQHHLHLLHSLLRVCNVTSSLSNILDSFSWSEATCATPHRLCCQDHSRVQWHLLPSMSCATIFRFLTKKFFRKNFCICTAINDFCIEWPGMHFAAANFWAEIVNFQLTPSTNVIRYSHTLKS